MRIARLSAIGATVALALGLAACGSDDEDTTTTAAGTTAATAAQKATGTPFKLGVIGSFSGSEASTTGLLPDVYKAWASSVNDSGGINGHPVELVIKDDATVPAKGIAAAKDLVRQDVIAIVGDISLVNTAWEKYVTDAGIPVVGGSPNLAPFSTNPNWFVVGSGLAVNTLASLQAAKDAGKKKVGILYCAEVAVCAQLVDLAKAAAKVVGGIEVTGQSVSATAPNFGPTCLSMKGKDVDALYLGLNAAIVPRVVDACASQGYKPFLTTDATTVANYWLEHPNLNGIVTSSGVANYADASIPAVKQFQDAVDRYAPGIREKDGYGVTVMFPWAAGKMFEAAAKAGDLQAPGTAEDVKKGLYALSEETLDGLVSPATYEKGKVALPTCTFGIGIEDQKIVSVGGTEMRCLDDAKATQLRGLLGMK